MATFTPRLNKLRAPPTNDPKALASMLSRHEDNVDTALRALDNGIADSTTSTVTVTASGTSTIVQTVNNPLGRKAQGFHIANKQVPVDAYFTNPQPSGLDPAQQVSITFLPLAAWPTAKQTLTLLWF